MIQGDRDGAVRVLAAGILFSRDVANGGTLFAAVTADSLLSSDLRAMAGVVHLSQPELSPAQKSVLRRALAQLPPDGLDWQSAVKREFAVLRMPVRTPEGSSELDAAAQTAVTEISQAYVAALDNPALLPELQGKIANAPRTVADMISNPGRVLEAKQNLAASIAQLNSVLQ